MAWPCISRVCCLARFWNQLDKSDLSVPLTIQNYSDIAEHEVRSVAKQVCASERAHGGDCSPRGPADGPGPRGSCKTRREPSYKPRDDYHPPGVPFPGVTQYKQDYKPWPIPRKEAFPWMSNGGGSVSDSPVRAEPAGSRGQRWEEESQTSSYRQEYRPWTGAKPAKSARKHAPAQYSSPGTETTHVPRETSYQAAYSGDVHRSLRLHHGEHLIPSAASNIQPAAVTQPDSNAPQPPSPPTLQQSVPPERTDLSGGNKAEDQLVRTKLPRNPSAVFQSGSRVSNI